MTLRYAWATLTGKVYVPQCEIDELLETGETPEGETIASEDDAFQYLARRRIRDAYCASHQPMKITDSAIDHIMP